MYKSAVTFIYFFGEFEALLFLPIKTDKERFPDKFNAQFLLSSKTQPVLLADLQIPADFQIAAYHECYCTSIRQTNKTAFSTSSEKKKKDLRSETDEHNLERCNASSKESKRAVCD